MEQPIKENPQFVNLGIVFKFPKVCYIISNFQERREVEQQLNIRGRGFSVPFSSDLGNGSTTPVSPLPEPTLSSQTMVGNVPALKVDTPVWEYSQSKRSTPSMVAATEAIENQGDPFAAIRARLGDEHAEITASISAMSVVQPSGNNHAPGIHAEFAADVEERRLSKILVANLRSICKQVERAQAKVNKGTYGICDGCGMAIDPRRLAAIPYVTLCLSCKEKERRT